MQSFRRTSRTPTLKAYLPYFEKRIDRRSNRAGIGTRFTVSVVRTSVEVDAALMDTIHEQILTIERQINAQVPEHDQVALHLNGQQVLSCGVPSPAAIPTAIRTP